MNSTVGYLPSYLRNNKPHKKDPVTESWVLWQVKIVGGNFKIWVNNLLVYGLFILFFQSMKLKKISEIFVQLTNKHANNKK